MSEFFDIEGHEAFFWENPTWGFVKSDNSGGSEEKSAGKKPMDLSTSNGPPVQKESEEMAVAGAAPVVVPVAGGSKKGGGGKKIGGGGGGGGSHEVINELGGKVGGENSDHEIHIWTERERRKKMRNMFSNLHALLPQLPPKADKSTIVDEAVNYIKTLQNTLQNLQKQKLERIHAGMNSMMNCDAFVITPQKRAIEYSSSSREAFLADQGSSTNNNNNIITFPSPIASSSNSLLQPRFTPATFQTWSSPNVILNVCGDDAHISICSVKKPNLLSGVLYVLEMHKLEVVSAQVSSDNCRIMYMIQAHANASSNQLAEAISVEEIYKQAAAEIMLWVNSSSSSMDVINKLYT